MKLLFSSLLFSLAASSEQEGRELAQPASPTALHARWDMSEPKINYLPENDKFTFTFMTASEDNYNEGLAESFWDPNCMPATPEAIGVPIGTPLIHRVGYEDELPFFTMEDVTLDPAPTSGTMNGIRPRMEFKINPAKFASEGGPTVYSGTIPSCDTTGVLYSLLLNNMECPDVHIFDDSSGLSEEECYLKCAADSGCTQFSFRSSDSYCFGCEGTAASLVPSAGVDTYEMCDSDVPAFNLVTGSTIDDCINTVTVVDLGTATEAKSCPHDNTALFDISDIGTKDDCYQRCYIESNCDFFTFSNINGGRCIGCTTLGDASYPGLKDVGMPGLGQDLCEGDCNDGSCAGELVCYERDPTNAATSGDTVPGCSGKISENAHPDKVGYYDYCIDNSVYSNFAICPRPPTPNNNANARIDFCIRSSLGYTSVISPTTDFDTRSCIGGEMSLYEGCESGGSCGTYSTPSNTKCCVKDNDVEFVPLGTSCPCSLVDLQSCDTSFLERRNSYLYKIENADCQYEGTGNPLFWSNTVFKQDHRSVGSFERISNGVGYFINGDSCGKPREGEISIETTSCLSKHRDSVVTEPSTCEYKWKFKCYDPESGNDVCSNPSPNNDKPENVNYQEVNFIETLVRIEYDMSSGFTVDSFSVAPKNRELTTISESYEDALIAYLCAGYTGPENMDDYFDSGGVKLYGAPKILTKANPFNQGALITVCVRVKEEFASQNIVLKEITDFSWTRSGGSTFNRAIGGGDDADATTITQVAITGSEAAGNYLTSFNKDDCNSAYWCNFASVLFAQFYNTPGSVSGTGDAILQFRETRNRRLGGVDERSLQGDPGSAGMDISIDVNGVAEGPGDLKTASGPSFGSTISVSVVTALVGAILLA